MKKFFIICICFSGSFMANAQTSAGIYSNKWEENDQRHHKIAMKQNDDFSNTEMETKNSIITFSGLPDLKKAYAAVITNGDGEIIKQKRISPQKNEISVQGLKRGLYFISILYKEKTQKKFVLNL
jgi:hypothetical protein